MAIQVYNHLSVDLVFDSTIPSIDVMQGDTARGLVVTYLTEINNLDNEDISAVIKVQRPDGMEGWAQGEVIKLGANMAQVIIDPSDDYTALIDVPGVAKAVLEVYAGDTVISTFKFRIDVKENPFYGTTIGSLTPKQLETVEQTAYSSAHDWMDEHPEASTTVQDGAISTAKLADNSVTSAKIVDGTIVNADISDNTIANAKLANKTITNAKMADKTVTAAKIADATITRAKLAADADLVPWFIGSTSSTSYTGNYDISAYRCLLLMVGTQDNAMLATTIIPLLAVASSNPPTLHTMHEALYSEPSYHARVQINFSTNKANLKVDNGQYAVAFLYGIK